MLRLFFALQPRLEQSIALCENVAPLVGQLGAPLVARTVPAQNLHATLCFIGVIEEQRLDALRAAAASIRGRPARLRFDALEYWETPKILCATTSRDSPAATELAIALGEASVAAGFSPDIKPFRAHLTLARKIAAMQAASVPWPLPLEPPMVVNASRFVLMSSRREGEVSIYSAVDSWPLYD
ncbi:MAG TPA: RNA 2',3'-cyclic phosphodiesterase [Steroidobacteraceae bacterium]|nr:RNA 2',3'-cyclic phosphodiesterase [Steroidobacteraceae bacterium]